MRNIRSKSDNNNTVRIENMTSVLKDDEIVREVIDLYENPYVVNNESCMLIIGIDKEEMFLFKISMKSI